MRVRRGLSFVIAVFCAVLVGSTLSLADESEKAPRKTRKKTVRAAGPSRPSGVAASPASADA